MNSISRYILLVLLQVLEQCFGNVDILFPNHHPLVFQVHPETVVKEVGFVILLLIVVTLMELLSLDNVRHLVSQVLVLEDLRLVSFHFLL